jgi:hypothetical protein
MFLRQQDFVAGLNLFDQFSQLAFEFTDFRRLCHGLKVNRFAGLVEPNISPSVFGEIYSLPAGRHARPRTGMARTDPDAQAEIIYSENAR